MKMELENFAQLIADGKLYNIKVALNALLGVASSEPSWGKALANLYKSFPEELKQSDEAKKELAPIMRSYFYIYSLADYNKDIFNDYFPLMSGKDKDRIKERNPKWNWVNDAPVVFKNVLEFVKAIPTSSRLGSINFIKKYEPQFIQFNTVKKHKILEHFKKRDIWKEMINRDYSDFSKFCEEYSFNKIEILNELLAGQQSPSLGYMGSMCDKQADLFFSDLEKIGKKQILEMDGYKKFVPTGSIPKDHQVEIISCLMTIIKKGDFHTACKYMDFFKEELQACANVLTLNKSFNKVEEFKEIVSAYGTDGYFSKKYDAKDVLANDAWFKYLGSQNLMKDLSSDLENNQNKKPKIKI